ncbi:MAG: hypothetical protein QM711_16105 [Micropruina sp.]|uniref:hypothetical protein n=1 Tax=Micropruina sp. TaxID=2737536 RepID=UPI0039E62EAC
MPNLTITFDPAIVEDLELYEAAADELRSHGAEVTVEEPPPGRAVVPFIPVVLAAVLAVGAVINFIQWWRDNHQYEQIITFKDGKLDVTIVPVRNGKILVFADKDTAVQITSTSPLLDLTEIAKAALTKGAEAAAKAANAVGAVAAMVQPADLRTRLQLQELAS